MNIIIVSILSFFFGMLWALLFLPTKMMVRTAKTIGFANGLLYATKIRILKEVNKKLNWKEYPQNKPNDLGKCAVILWNQGELGLSKYLWCANWNGERFEDYSGCNDIKKGAGVKYFIEETKLNLPI